MAYCIEQEVKLGTEEEAKPIKITRWILETRTYPSGKVVHKVFPTTGATQGYKKKEQVGDAEVFKKATTNKEEL